MSSVGARIAEVSADVGDFVPPKRTDPTKRDRAATTRAASAEVRKETARGSKSSVTLFDAKGFSVLDLMHETFAPMAWAVEEYIPEGLILVAGKPKSGKSWFVLNLMLSAKLNERFLKKPVIPSGGLYLALEDNPRRMQSRMRLLMGPYGDKLSELEGFEYRCEWPAGAEGAAALDEYLGAHPGVKIVAVDVLKNIRPKKTDRSQNDYEKDYEALEPWKQVAQARRVTLLVVHHTRKSEADDVFDEISGTLGLNGVVDQMIVLKSVPGNHKQATVHMRGRDLVDDHELGLELKGGWWELIGSAREIATSSVRKLVIDVMRDQGVPMTCSEIQKATGRRSRPSTDKLLNKMAEDGLISKAGHRYSVAL